MLQQTTPKFGERLFWFYHLVMDMIGLSLIIPLLKSSYTTCYYELFAIAMIYYLSSLICCIVHTVTLIFECCQNQPWKCHHVICWVLFMRAPLRLVLDCVTFVFLIGDVHQSHQHMIDTSCRLNNTYLYWSNCYRKSSLSENEWLSRSR